MILIRKDFRLDSFYEELIISVTVGTAAIFAVLGGPMNDRLGRRPVAIIASVLFTLGSFLMAFAPSKEFLLAGRAVVGMGVGLASMTMPMFISEVAPVDQRGRLITINNGFITGGQFIAACVDGFFANTEEGWRYMLGIGAAPAIIMFVGFVFYLPESPRWRLMKGQEEESKEILKRIRADAYTESEFEHLKADIASNQEQSLMANLRSKTFRRALFLGCGLQIFQQLAGINTVMYYSASIMEMSGVRDPSLAIWMAAVTAFVNFAFTFVGIYCVEKFGRRKLTLSSMLGVVLTLSLLAAGFFVSSHHSDAIDVLANPFDDEQGCHLYTDCNACQMNPECGYCYYDGEKEEDERETVTNFCFPINEDIGFDDEEQSTVGLCQNGTQKDSSIWWTETYCPSKYSWMSLLGMVLYLMAFAPGMGPMPWTLNAEIYPQSGRSLGNSIATTTNWVTNFVVSLTFLSITEAFTTQGAFLFYAGLSVFGFAFMYLFVPETKGVPLEDIPKLFEDGQVQVRGCCGAVKSLESTDLYDKMEKEDK